MPYLWDDQAWADYQYWLTQDKKTLRRINALLKDIPRHGELMDTLEIWDDRLAALGASIMAERTYRVMPPREAKVITSTGSVR